MKTKLFVFVAIASVTAASQALVIDTFTDGAYSTGYVNSGSVTVATSASVLGGKRITGLQIISNPFNEDSRLRVLPAAGGGMMAVSSGPGLDHVGRLMYGKSLSIAGTVDLNIDLTSTPILQLSMISSEALTVRTELYSGGALIGAVMASNGGSLTPYTMNFDFSAFNLTDVDSILYKFDPLPGGDYVVGSAQAVPEPATMAALALGAGALLRRKRK